MHLVTSFKHWSLILPAASRTLGDIFVYALPKWQPNLPKIPEKGRFLLHYIVYPRGDTYIDGDPSINLGNGSSENSPRLIMFGCDGPSDHASRNEVFH